MLSNLCCLGLPLHSKNDSMMPLASGLEDIQTAHHSNLDHRNEAEKGKCTDS